MKTIKKLTKIKDNKNWKTVTSYWFERTKTLTIRNGNPTISWDAWLTWKDAVVEYFSTVQKYHGYPTLPDFWMDGDTIYKEANKTERQMIAFTASGLFVEALRHWRTDLDHLYPNQKRQLLNLG